jgi:hypothetical protein
MFDRIIIKKEQFWTYDKPYTSLLLLNHCNFIQDNNQNDYQQQEFKLAKFTWKSRLSVAIRGFTIAHKNPKSETAQIAYPYYDINI